MTHHEGMKTSELRKMLKEHRKTHVAPVGKMTKVALLRELDKFAGTPSAMPSHAPVEVKRPAVVKEEIKVEEGKKEPKKKAVKVEVPTGIQGHTSHTPAKAARAEVEVAKPVARARLVKGSAEAIAFMASIRMKKSKDKDVS